MIDIGSAAFLVALGLATMFMAWVLWQTIADESRRHNHHYRAFAVLTRAGDTDPDDICQQIVFEIIFRGLRPELRLHRSNPLPTQRSRALH